MKSVRRSPRQDAMGGVTLSKGLKVLSIRQAGETGTWIHAGPLAEDNHGAHERSQYSAAQTCSPHSSGENHDELLPTRSRIPL